MTSISQSVAVGPSIEPLAQTHTHTPAQSANQSQQQQQMAVLQQQGYAMMQGALLWFLPFSMIAQGQYQADQAAPQGSQVQQLEPVGQMTQQPTTPGVSVMQQAMMHWTPPHLTSLQDSSVGQTPHQSVESQLGAFPTGAAVGGDGRAVDPPTQGAVEGMDMCVKAWITLLWGCTEANYRCTHCTSVRAAC